MHLQMRVSLPGELGEQARATILKLQEGLPGNCLQDTKFQLTTLDYFPLKLAPLETLYFFVSNFSVIWKMGRFGQP
ncbi:hypothetical protein DS906_08590 [Ruegeria sp. A3M17]|nr:hypothetical protein DS906_08590 [Ruegeria sp. A3M17]